MDGGISIVSYNVHECVGRDRRFMPERILAVLRRLDADFIALQEVSDRLIDGVTVSEFLARELAMHAYPGMTMQRRGSGFGNLLLASRPAADCRRSDLSVSGREPRGLISADFELPAGRVSVLATHLGLAAAERSRQVAQLLLGLDEAQGDVKILAGDINEWRPWAHVRRTLRRRFGMSAAVATFPSDRPAISLDRIYVAPHTALRDVQAVTTEPARIASDHLPVRATVCLSPGPPEQV